MHSEDYMPTGKSKQVLEILGTDGPCAAYTIFKKHGIPTATVQKAIKDLKEKDLIECSNEEKGVTGKTKKIYSVTMNGFCVLYVLIYESKGAYGDYNSLKSLILNNPDIFPLISNKWDYLVSPDHPFKRGVRPSDRIKYQTIDMAAMRKKYEHPMEAWWYGALYEVLKKYMWGIREFKCGESKDAWIIINEGVLHNIFEIICDYPHNEFFDSFMDVLKKDPELWDISKKILARNYGVSRNSSLKYKEYIDSKYIDPDSITLE